MNNSIPPDDRDSSNTPTYSVRRSRLLRIAVWAAACLACVAVLLVLTGTVLLNSARFHDYVLRRVQDETTSSLGVPVHLQNYSIHLNSLSVDLYGLTVNGAAPYSNPPILQVDHAQASVRIISVFQRKWYLDNIQLDRPIVRVYVDAQGHSNIPTIKTSNNSTSNTTIFDLGIRHALLSRGEAYYNDRHSALDADLHDLDFRAAYNPFGQQYSGQLSYADGHLVSGTFQPLPHSLDADFDATPTTFHLKQARLSSGPSQINLVATLQNYSSPRVDLRYDVFANGQQIRQVLHIPSIPSGILHTSGTAQYQQVANRTLLASLLVHGDLSSAQLDVTTPTLRTRVNNLAAHYDLVNGDVTLQDLHAGLLGGAVTASGKMTALGGDSHTKVIAALKNVSLAQLRNLAGVSSVAQNVALNGTLNAQASATWGKNIDDLVANVDATMDGHLVARNTAATKASSTPPAQMPINSSIRAIYHASNKQVQFSPSYIRTPKTDLALNGLLSDHSSLNVRLQCDDLREVEAVADLFRPSTPGQPLGLDGTASFQGAVQGTVASPRLTGKLLASNFHVHGSGWKLLRTNVDLSPSLASLQQAEVQPMGRGRITMNASAVLSNWAFSNTSPIQLQLDAQQLDIAEFIRLAGTSIPVTGILNASISAHGSALSPSGNGSISISNVVAYEEPIQSVKITFNGTGDEVHSDLSVSLPAGTLLSKFSIRPQQKTYTAQVSTSGIHIEKLQALKTRNIDATGVLALNATSQGSFEDPQGDATIEIPQLVVQKQTISGLNLRVNVNNHLAKVNLSSSALNTSIRANARVSLTGDYLADAALDTAAIPFQPLIAIYAPAQAGAVTGQTELHATLHGPLKNAKQLEAHLTIPTLNVAYGSTVQLAAAAPIHIDYKDGIVQLQRSAIRGTDTDLQLEGSIPTQGHGPMSLLMQGTVNLQLAQLINPDYRTSGELKFNINSHGDESDQSIGGEIQIVNANVASADLPVGLQHGNGVLTLTKDRLTISKFQGSVGGGTLTAQGGITYQPNIQFNVALAAQGIRMLYPQGVRESVDANIRLSGSTDRALLNGSVNLSDLSFTSGFDLSSFINQFSGGVATPPSQGFSQNVQLNLAVRSTNDVNLISRTLSVGGSANLQVRGTAADPVILGRINLNSGDVILNGSRFVLNGGTIQFVNPSETEPVVNVSLNTNIQQYNIYLRFNGPINQLRTEYSSDPALPSADIINLLAFGNTTEYSAANSTPANQAAESLIASQVSSQVTSRFSKIAGISQLSINPVLSGAASQSNPGATITIQQRVTGNLFITFSSNVASTQNQTIQGQYQVSPRVAVSATRDQNGGFAVDTLIKKSW